MFSIHLSPATLSAIFLFASIFLCSNAKFCPPGKYILPSGTRCALCPAGTYTAIHSQNSCTPCPEGTFSSTLGIQGVDLCRRCSPGTFSYSRGSTKCEACPPGTNSTAGAFRCFACRPGYGISSYGHCRYCPFGTYRDGNDTSQTCRKCPQGLTTLKEEATSIDQCVKCPVGTEDNGPSGCQPCRPRYYRPLLGDYDRCVVCPPGQFSDSYGATSCKPCPASTYKGNPYAARCSDCPPGLNSVQGAASCSATCPSGFFSFPGRNGCGSCLAGYFHNTTTGLCDICPSGSVSPGEKVASCTPCSNGMVPDKSRRKCVCGSGSFVSIADDGAVECKKCQPGTGSETGLQMGEKCPSCAQDSISDGSGHCIPCGEGTVANANHTACIYCEAPLIAREVGNWLKDGTVQGEDRCVSSVTNCPLNYTRWTKNGRLLGCKRVGCPEGSFGSESGCKTCSRGEKLVGYNNFARCEECPKKMYSDGGLSRVCAHKCSNGFVRNGNKTLIYNTACVCSGIEAAGRGYIHFKCRTCPKGTYNAGAPGTAVCSPCPPGTFNDRRGMKRCMPCARNTFTSYPGSKRC